MTDTASDNATDMTDSLSVTEAAAHLGVSERTVWRRIKQGKIKTHKTTDGVRVSLSDMPTKVSDATPVSDSKVTDRATDSVSDTPKAEVEATRLMLINRQLEEEKDQAKIQLGFALGQLAMLSGELTKAREEIERLKAPRDIVIDQEPEPPAAPERVSWWRRLLGG